MAQYNLVKGDVQYFAFYLKEKDPTSGSITSYDLTTASSIVFSLKKYNASSNTIDVTMTVITPTLGYCRVLGTVPIALGAYSSQVEVFETLQRLTWIGPEYNVLDELH